MTGKTDTNPSFALKVQAYLWSTSLIAVVAAFCISVLFNVAGSRLYILVVYASLRLLVPGGMFGSERTPRGGVWRKFSEHYYAFKLLRKYLELEIVPAPTELAKAEAEKDAQFVFAAFPHGTNSDFRVLLDGMFREVIPNIIEQDRMRTLAASILFRIPIVREIALWTGCIDASRKCAEAALVQKKSLLVLPGGEAEQIRTIYGRERIFLTKRKGFIKLAMRTGVPVVPMYVFGSSDAYYTYPKNTDKNNSSNDSQKFDWSFYQLRHKLQKNFGICITLCSGLWGSPLCPLPKKTTIVFGKPIWFESSETPKSDSKSCGFEPTSEELDKGHALFVKELTALFDEHKTRLGYGDRTLEVI